MKIIFALPDMGSGGAERVVSLLSSELNEMGYDVEIMMMFGTRMHYTISSDVNVVTLRLASASLWNRIKAVRKYLKESAKNEKTVVVPFQDSVLNTCLAASLGLGISVVACERNNPYIKGISFMQKLKAMLPYWMADYCVFQTPDAREYYTIVSDKRCSVIINPITIPDVTWGGQMNEKNLISICRLHHQKNLPMTLDVISKVKQRYPEIHLRIYGEGELKETLEEEVIRRNLSDNIEFCGTTRQVPYELSKSSIFISTSDFEGISNSMLEAMAIGVPMVCTDCPIGGARLMLSNGSGILTPVGNFDIFADRVTDLLNGTIDYNVMSETAKVTAAQYTPSKIAKSWSNIFKRIG